MNCVTRRGHLRIDFTFLLSLSLSLSLSLFLSLSASLSRLWLGSVWLHFNGDWTTWITVLVRFLLPARVFLRPIRWNVWRPKVLEIDSLLFPPSLFFLVPSLSTRIRDGFPLNCKPDRAMFSFSFFKAYRTWKKETWLKFHFVPFSWKFFGHSQSLQSFQITFYLSYLEFLFIPIIFLFRKF